MAEYEEIETAVEIKRLNRLLSKTLKAALRVVEHRVIGYPRDSFDATVRFKVNSGDGAFWWSGNLAVGGNHFGHGRPGQSESLSIDVQFNFPVETFNRRQGGCFLLHRSTGRVILAHRGILTLGHGRVPRDAVFAEMAASLLVADTSAGAREFLVVGELGSRSIVRDISRFSSNVREVVRRVEDQPAKPRMVGDHPTGKNTSSSGSFGKLKKYFKEFRGKQKRKTRRGVVADCYHGVVVDALASQLNACQYLKSREIDLVARKGKRAFLFEVKTASNPQSVYTAIGQLEVHAPVVAKLFPKLSIAKVVVMPDLPPKRLQDTLSKELSIHVLTFVRTSDGEIVLSSLRNFASSN